MAQHLPRIGYLGGGSAELEKPWLYSFRQGLRDLGYVEGKNVLIDGRYAAGRYEQLPALTAELLQLQVNVIIAPILPVILAAKEMSKTIPIVMVTNED